MRGNWPQASTNTQYAVFTSRVCTHFEHFQTILLDKYYKEQNDMVIIYFLLMKDGFVFPKASPVILQGLFT